MDLLKAEIAKKRSHLESQKLAGVKRYCKRSVLRVEQDKNHKSKYTKEKANESDEDSFSKKDAEDNLLLKKFEERTREEREKGQLMPRKEVVRQLRERNQPIRLFGESDYDTFQRLKRVQLLEPESKGMRNDLIAALDKVDDADDEEFYASGRGQSTDVGPSGDPNAPDVKTKGHTLAEEEILKMKLVLARYVSHREGTATDDATRAVIQISKTDPENDTTELEEGFREKVTEYVLRYLKFLLYLWGHHLNSRSKEEKLTYIGKIGSATYTQTVDYIKPLLRALQKCCRDDILDSLVKIVTLMMDGNYLKANDAYLELAIGNAPWPLGVTNHGIHSRTAQEKIHAKNVAHVLNDETQRKYIQAIKRLMTQCQKYFPSDPSKSINYMGTG